MNIAAIHVSPGHNYFGHHGHEPGSHPLLAVDEVECLAGRGLRGDRFLDYRSGYRGQVTFFAEEVHRGLLREVPRPMHGPGVYRRNILTAGVDLGTLIGREFTVQGVTFRGTGECAPCHWMNRAVGPGAEAWLRGRGGLRAVILSDGLLRVDRPLASGVLLAGGRSRRMGSDKAALAWRGGTLGEHQALTLARAGCWPLRLSCRAEQAWTPPGFARLEDPTGPGGALEAVVRALEAATSPVVVVLAVDLPRVTAPDLAALADGARASGISVVPRGVGGFEPLAAAWHRSALPLLREGVRAGTPLRETCGRLAADGLLQVREGLAGEEAWEANVNTPEDVARWRT